MIYVDMMNTTYQDIITIVLLNTMLHHIVMLWIIENYEQLQYDMEEKNCDYILVCSIHHIHIYH